MLLDQLVFLHFFRKLFLHFGGGASLVELYILNVFVSFQDMTQLNHLFITQLILPQVNSSSQVGKARQEFLQKVQRL